MIAIPERTPRSNEQMPSINIGRFRIDRVEEFLLPGFAPNALYPVFDPSVFKEWSWLAGPSVYDPVSKNLMSSLPSWILRDGQKTIIIDTGVGNGKKRDYPGFGDRFHMVNTPYLERLAAIGIKPSDVTHVVITHLHMDHVGWNTINVNGSWVPTFPNARYVFGREDMQRVLSPVFLAKGGMAERVADDSLLPVIDAGLVDPAEHGMELFPGFSFEAAPGHTPDQLAIRVRSDDVEALFTADAFHTPIQIVRPDWSSRFALDPKAAQATRESILERAAKEGTILFPSHFCDPFYGRIVRYGSGYRFAGLDGKILGSA
jgi:glyoxylase-like metal-dependent hydrolase (beta-lactamase superfamily II)